MNTSLDMKDETLVWDVYNTIREIENTFRTLKTDLDLRPIYHKNDDSTVAHLYLGLLAYWLVNTTPDRRSVLATTDYACRACSLVFLITARNKKTTAPWHKLWGGCV
ncbi:MAG: hypothetical protein R2795_20610 [Saprospiraceae bacterium]